MLNDTTISTDPTSSTLPTTPTRPTRPRKTKLIAAVHEQLGEPPTAGPLARTARKLKQRATVPANEDPAAELRRLVQDHKALTKKAVAIKAMVSGFRSRVTGELIPSRVPEDRAREMVAVSDALKADADRLQTLMLRELRRVPVYTQFLAHVFGLGPVVCAYIVALIDPMAAERRDYETRNGVTGATDEQVLEALERGEPLRSTKPSNVLRFCGLAVIGGRLERPTRGQKLGYCAELRTRIYQAMSSLWKNAAKKTAAAPYGSTSKYLDVWRWYKHRMLCSERYDGAKNRLLSGQTSGSEREEQGASGLPRTNAIAIERASDAAQANANDQERSGEDGRSNVTQTERAIRSEQMRGSMSDPTPGGAQWRPGARAVIHATGWHKSADVLIEDLYMVWRSILGLPVWPSYYAAKLGYSHGGRISVNAPRLLSVEEALEMVGEVGARPLDAPAEVDEVEDPGDGDEGEEI